MAMGHDPKAGPPKAEPAKPGYGTGRREALRLAALVACGLLADPRRGAAQGAGAGAGAAADTVAFPEGAQVWIGGPSGGELAAWARTLLPLVGQALPAGTDLRHRLVGGVDGVTAANHFHAEAQPDGQSVLMLPGAAALAWMMGDPRVRFDCAQWLPLLTTFCPAVLVGRADPSRLAPGHRVRVAATRPYGPDLAAMLALELIGLEPVPTVTPSDAASARAAFSQHAVDLVLVTGRQVDAQVADLQAMGGQAICILGMPEATGQFTRAAAMPGLPHFQELLAETGRGLAEGPLGEAWRAVVGTMQTSFTLVLPRLSPAAAAALWRRVGEQAIARPEMQQAAMQGGMALRPGGERLAAAAISQEALGALRAWAGSRLQWRPA